MENCETEKSTELDKMINDNFFFPAQLVKNDKLFRHRLSESMDTGNISLKKLIKFLRNNQAELEKQYHVFPIELLNEEEFPDSEIEKLEDEYSEKKKDGGYTRFLLERIYDRRFKEELNKKHQSYFQIDTNLNHGIDYDFVDDFLHKIKDANFDLSRFSDKKELRARKYKEKDIPVEPVDNIFTLFKCYAQGEYSKILIALENNKESIDFPCKNLEKMRKEGFDVILNDDAIKEFIPTVRYLPVEENCKLDTYYQALIYERQEKQIYLELQRWFDDFIPSDLERIYRKETGKTLRYVLRDDCKNIKVKVCNIPSNLIEKVYNDGDVFSGSQISRINKLYAKYCNEITEYKTVREKIELLIDAIEESEKKKKSWQEIIGRYKETYKLSLDSFIPNNDGDESSLLDSVEDDKKDYEEIVEEEINRIISSFREEYADKLYDLFLDEFRSNPCFRNEVAKEILNHEKLESIYLSEIPLPVIYNSIQCITKMITKKDIRHVSDEAELFNFESLKNKPFCFIESQIAKFRMIFLIEDWRHHPSHPWRAFWKLFKKHLPKKTLDFEQFTKKMERIYSEVKSWK